MAKPKLSTIFLLLSLGLSLGVVVYLYMGLDAEQTKRIWTEGQLEKVTQAKEELQKERDELTQAKQALEGQLADAATQAKTISEQLAQEKRARETVASELSRVSKESSQLKSQLQGERQEKEGMSQDLAKAKQRYQALSAELTTLRQAKEALEKRVKEMLAARSQEAERIVVTPRPGQEIATGRGGELPAGTAKSGIASSNNKSMEGKVLVVNREFNFVVVNLGSKDGIKTGTSLSIVKSGKTIGRADVERVYENMCAATVLQEEQKGKIQEGDQVRVAA